MRRASSGLLLLSLIAGGWGCGSEGAEGRAVAPATGGQSAGGQTSVAGQPPGLAGNAAATGGSAGAGGTQTAPGGGSGGSAGQSASAGGPNLSGSPVVFVGGFGEGAVLAYELDEATGALTQRQTIDAGPEPTCFATDPAKTRLFVCNEGDGPSGGITSFALGPDGTATFINHQSGSDDGYTSLVVHPSGKFIAGAAYGGGSSSVFPILGDGSVGAQVSVADFGNGAQAHGVAYGPGGQHLLVATKGTDTVQQLLQSETGMLTPNAPPNVPAASGPRHLAVHPNGKLVFVVAENGSALTSYRLSVDGKLTETAEVSSLPADYQGDNTGAHVELSPNGNVLYASNRGHDSIGVFSVDAETGVLTLIEFEPARGESPHDFDIDASGQLLVAANRRSSTLTVFQVAADGSLNALGQPVATRDDPTGVLIHYPQ